MDIPTAVLLGVIQGVAEWLPVSSEAVVTLVMTRVLGRGAVEAVNAAVWIHTGTMLAALLYFRGRFLSLLDAELPEEPMDLASFTTEQRLLAFLLIATAITGLVGGPLYLLGLKEAASNPDIFAGLMAGALLVTGALHHRSGGGGRTIDTVDRGDTALSGALQGLSILPGLSRSGVTTFAFLHRDLAPRDAFVLSFLMSVPAVLVANIGINLLSGFSVTTPLLVAALAAFVTGYLTIGTVLRLADHASIPLVCLALAVISALPLLV